MFVRIKSRTRLGVGALHLEPGDEGVIEERVARGLGGQVHILGPAESPERGADTIVGATNRMQKAARTR